MSDPDWDLEDFQVFEAQARPRRLRADEVSLTKTNIVISEALAKKLGESKRVLLMYNENREEIGLRPIDSDEQGYKLSYRSISSRAFYQCFNITARGRFKAHVNRLGMLIVRLREPSPK